MTDRAYSLLTVIAVVGALAGCAGVKQAKSTGAAGAAGSGSGAGGAGNRPVITGAAGTSVIPETCNGMCTDFPLEPRFDVGVSRDVAGMFGAPTRRRGALRHRARERNAVPEQLAAAARARAGLDGRPQDHLSRGEAG